MKYLRDIIEINEDLCDGCGQCVIACAEGAIQIIDGKAKLVNDAYCDGIGDCLGECPLDALKIIKRKAVDFDEEAALSQASEAKKTVPKSVSSGSGCPGSAVRNLKKETETLACGCSSSEVRSLKKETETLACGCSSSEVRSLPKEATPASELKDLPESSSKMENKVINWPLQLSLVPVEAAFLDSKRLILAADCSGFVTPEFHNNCLDGESPLIIACPKLDDNTDLYISKLSTILKKHPMIEELKVVFMTVPCCGGLCYVAQRAIDRAERDVAMKVVQLSPEGVIQN